MAGQIFKTTGHMNTPRFSCDQCFHPFPPDQLYRQDGGLYCRKHIRQLSRRQLTQVLQDFDEYWELSPTITIGGRTSRR